MKFFAYTIVWDSRTWRVGVMRRRITMALLPIMYKLGVSTTLLGVLVFIGLKTAAMVSVLFVLAIGSFAKHKFAILANSHNPTWTQVPVAPPATIQKEVHVHVHADPHKQSDSHQPWGRKPVFYASDEYETEPAQSYPYGYYGGTAHGNFPSGSEPEIIYRAPPPRRWPVSRQTTLHQGSTSASVHPQLIGTLPSTDYALNSRWALQRSSLGL